MSEYFVNCLVLVCNHLKPPSPIFGKEN